MKGCAEQSHDYFCPINGVVHNSRFSYCPEILLPKSPKYAKTILIFNLGAVSHLVFVWSWF